MQVFSSSARRIIDKGLNKNSSTENGFAK